MRARNVNGICGRCELNVTRAFFFFWRFSLEACRVTSHRGDCITRTAWRLQGRSGPRRPWAPRKDDRGTDGTTDDGRTDGRTRSPRMAAGERNRDGGNDIGRAHAVYKPPAGRLSSPFVPTQPDHPPAHRSRSSSVASSHLLVHHTKADQRNMMSLVSTYRFCFTKFLRARSIPNDLIFSKRMFRRWKTTRPRFLCNFFFFSSSRWPENYVFNILFYRPTYRSHHVSTGVFLFS